MKLYSNTNTGCHSLSLLPHQSGDPVVVAEQILNPHQSLRAEVVALNGRPVVRLSRWKMTTAGPQRTGQVFEFGAHRIADVAKMIAEVQRHLELNGESCAS